MLKIAICDDDVRELNKTREMCITYQTLHPEYEIRLSSFTSAVQLRQNILNQEKYDILLLDIYMPDLTGIDLAKFLRESSYGGQIIFLTTSVSHAIEAFSLHAAHYLVKPYSQEELTDALSTAIKAIEKQQKAQIMLKISGAVHLINFVDFLYAETDKHIQKVYLNGGKCIQVRITSTELYDMLTFDGRFYKCGSTYIINIGRVEEISKTEIVFDDGRRIPMQRRRYKELLEYYTGFALEDIG